MESFNSGCTLSAICKKLLQEQKKKKKKKQRTPGEITLLRRRGVARIREEKEKKPHPDLTFISGADPLSGRGTESGFMLANSNVPPYKIPFHFVRGLRGWLERRGVPYLQ